MVKIIWSFKVSNKNKKANYCGRNTIIDFAKFSEKKKHLYVTKWTLAVFVQMSRGIVLWKDFRPLNCKNKVFFISRLLLRGFFCKPERCLQKMWPIKPSGLMDQVRKLTMKLRNWVKKTAEAQLFDFPESRITCLFFDFQSLDKVKELVAKFEVP